MTVLHDLLHDMIVLENELHRFETEFGVRSADFYQAIMRGDLEEFDALDEYRMTFLEWLALYKTWLSFDEKYQQLIHRQPVAVQLKTSLEMVHV
ncbi:MAG: hypothetical protein GWP17_04995 [Aquificales bacterium]|nr:hypothetical protein [Aquificales bacterium]